MALISTYDGTLPDDVDNNSDVELEIKKGDELFLDLLTQKRCLFDKELKEYSDRLVKSNAWQDISKAMDESGIFTKLL